MKDRLYLLDGYSLIYRSYFAFIHRPLRNPQGRNSSAIFGFFNSLFSFLKQYEPRYFAVTLDSTVPTFRHEKYAEYKATREKTPQDLKDQIPVIEEILDTLGIPQVRVNGFEADDVMATLATRCREGGRECFLITGDKDILQLVDGPVKVLRPKDGSFFEIGRNEVAEEWGVHPEQILDYLSLVGDSSDNVPGVKGIGAKTAAALLTQFGTLDEIYAHLEEISSKSWKTKLSEGRESAYLSRDLITLVTEVPLDRGVDDLELPVLDRQASVPLFLNEGMRTLAREVEAAGKEGALAADSPSASESHGKGSSSDGDPPPENEDAASSGGPVKRAESTREGTYPPVTTMPELEDWLTRIKNSGIAAFDSETDNLNAMRARPVGFSFAVSPGEACYIPLVGPDGRLFEEEKLREALRGVLEDPSVKIVGQNLKYDYQVLSRWGIRIANPAFDTMIAAWLLDTTLNTYNMDVLAERELGFQTIHYDDVVPRAKRGEERGTFDSVALAKASDYAAEDADITLRLYLRYKEQLEERGLMRIFRELEMPLVPLLAEMEMRGIKLEAATLNDYSVELERQLGEIEREIYRLCGKEFNIASTKQLQEVLFVERKLKPVKKTKTGYSTDTAVLQELAQDDPVPERVLRHRLLSKLKSTYVDSLPLLVNPETGRLHTSYHQTGTATGRLSSKDPNLQNIPIRDEEGRRIREAFVPADGCVFVSADYAQIELVVLAHLSGDEALSRAFRDGTDVHRRTGALIFGVAPEEVTAEQRRIAKTINFGVMYGMSAFRLSRELGIPRADADHFIERYFSTYSGIKSFIDKTVLEAEKSGRVRTLMGRERPLPDITNRNRTVKMGAERIAVNTPIQGSAADIMKLAMLAVTRRLESDGLRSRVLLQVHDELILEVPAEETERVKSLLTEEMTGVVELDVPLSVSVESGHSWGELH